MDNLKCSECGTQIIDGAKFCQKCGAPCGIPKEPQEDVQKPKKKKILIIIISLILVVAIAVSAVIFVPKFLNKKDEENTPYVTGIKMSDDLFDFTFKLDGSVLSFPCEFEDLNDCGWEMSDDEYTEDYVLSPGENVGFDMSKNDSTIKFYSYNPTNKEMPLEDCPVGSVQITDNDDVDFSIAKGISIDSTAKEVEDAFGKAERIYDDNDEFSITYTPDEFYKAYIKFHFVDEKNCDRITLYNCVVTEDEAEDTVNTKTAVSDVKFGLILLHDENSTYDKSFLDAAKAACDELGVEAIIKTNISESSACTEAAEDLAEQGCNVIFANSFGHEDFMIEAAKEYPDVHFCHATGTKAHTENLANYHNAFASIYEGRYLTGVAAGMKLNELKEAGKLKGDVPKIGFVGAFSYAEVISSYTAFYLGAKSVCSDVVMDVQFTGSWYDETAEKEAAQKFINSGCDLISQYADSMGAPTACEKAGIPNISYNGSNVSSCPNTYIVSSEIDWTPYFKYIINCALGSHKIDTDWTGSLSTGSVCLTSVNNKAAASGTQAKLDEVSAKLKSGELQVFDTSKFTVNGKKLTSYMADVDTDLDFAPDTQVVSDGAFNESAYRSAPYFDLQIDGITLLNTTY